MNRSNSMRLGFVIAILGMVLNLGILVGCDDNEPPVVNADTGQGDTGQWDTGTPWPDTNPPVDQYVWPDQQADQTIWPDTYSGTPFGCNDDSDCFGQKCCTTPWGVKLCQPNCS